MYNAPPFMGFLSDRRDLPVKVLITAPAMRTAAFDLSRFRVGEVYEVAPRVAEYLISSDRAIIERRRFPRRKPRRTRPSFRRRVSSSSSLELRTENRSAQHNCWRDGATGECSTLLRS